MQTETREIAQVVERQYQDNGAILESIATAIKRLNPPFLMTIARGSSDHAASFLQYLFGKELGLICASVPPSLTSLYDADLKVNGAVAIAISQSGASPDICHTLQRVKENGALTIALTNHPNSPLAKIADFVIPLQAGKEQSVAASKTYMASIFAIVHLLSFIKPEINLQKALENLPNQLIQNIHIDFSRDLAWFQKEPNLIIIARGLLYPIAQEAALKCKETCQIHAEPFSAAEFQHGPMALVQENFPLIIFAQHDETQAGVFDLSEKLTRLGAKTLLVCDEKDIPQDRAIASHYLSLIADTHPALLPILYIQAFYFFVAELALKKNRDPDNPTHLQKITKTH